MKLLQWQTSKKNITGVRCKQLYWQVAGIHLHLEGRRRAPFYHGRSFFERLRNTLGIRVSGFTDFSLFTCSNACWTSDAPEAASQTHYLSLLLSATNQTTDNIIDTEEYFNQFKLGDECVLPEERREEAQKAYDTLLRLESSDDVRDKSYSNRSNLTRLNSSSNKRLHSLPLH